MISFKLFRSNILITQNFGNCNVNGNGSRNGNGNGFLVMVMVFGILLFLVQNG